MPRKARVFTTTILCALAAVLATGGAAYGRPPSVVGVPLPSLHPASSPSAPQHPAGRGPLQPNKAGASSATAPTAATPTIADVTESNAPPYSFSWYANDSDLKNASTAIKNMGVNAPSHPDQLVFLEVGGWCTSNSTHVDPYGGTCSESASDNYTVAYDLEWYMYGYEITGTHAQQQSMGVAATTNNSVAGSNTTNANAQGRDWQGAVNANLAAYANTLNNYNASNGFPLRFYAEAGNDLETNFGGPAPATQWVSGFNAVDSAGLGMDDNGAYYGTCASAGCWNTALDHGWSAAQKYYTSWGATDDFGFPEIYNTGWPTYYRDLDSAAAAVGSAANYGVPVWDGVMWGCGTGGNEPGPAHAWADFANTTGQSTSYLTYIHSLSKSC
jgi:hypothetical protein